MFDVPALPFTIVAHVLGIGAVVMVLVWTIHFEGGLAWAWQSRHSFNLHPVLMLIGLIVIGGEAIMSYKSLPFKKEVKKVVHMVLNAIALILGCIGIYIVFKFHEERHINNLYSLHSWVGIVVIVLYGLQWLYGFFIYIFPGVPISLKKASVPWHVIFGLFVYILAVLAAALGFLEDLTFLEKHKLAKYGAEALLVNFTAVVTILYGAFVVFSVLALPSPPPPPPPQLDDYTPI
ncbi:hypothetical protein ACFE04_028725 [Oxalis oulophora]